MNRCPKCEAMAAVDPLATRWLLDHVYRRIAELYHGRMQQVEDCPLMPHRDDPYRL